MKKKVTIPKATKGYGYSGVWSDGTIGWFVTPFVSGKFDRKYPSIVETNPNIEGKRFFLCEIIIKPLIDKKGRPITKIVKPTNPLNK